MHFHYHIQQQNEKDRKNSSNRENKVNSLLRSLSGMITDTTRSSSSNNNINSQLATDNDNKINKPGN